ncbi:hypothetical protein [Streptomyces sp. NPDC003710]
MATQIRIITVGAEGYGTVWVRLVAANSAAFTSDPSTAELSRPP